MEGVAIKVISISLRQIKMQNGNTTSMTKLCKRDTKIKDKIRITLNIKKATHIKIINTKIKKETEIKTKCKTWVVNIIKNTTNTVKTRIMEARISNMIIMLTMEEIGTKTLIIIKGIPTIKTNTSTSTTMKMFSRNSRILTMTNITNKTKIQIPMTLNHQTRIMI